MVIRGQKPTQRFSVIQIIGGIWLVIGLVVLVVMMLGPSKPPPPPPSRITVEERPERPDYGGPSVFGGKRTRDPDIARQARDDEDPTEYPYVVFGFVREQGGGKPLANCVVVCTFRGDEDGERVASTLAEDLALLQAVGGGGLRERKRGARTDDQGRYAVRVPRPGVYDLVVNRVGYIAGGKELTVSDEMREVRADVELSLGASVSGRVTETGSRNGIQRIVVLAGRSSAETDAEGHYTVTGLHPGSLEVSLDLSGQPYKAPGRIPVANVVIETPDQQVTGVDFVLDPAGTVWGYITGPEKEPVRGVDLLLCSSDSVLTQAINAVVNQAPPLSDDSGEDGYYQLVGVPLGKEWRVYAMSKEEWAPQLSDPFLLTERQRTLRVDIFMLPGSTVTGRVVSLDGTPVPYADVVCLPGYSRLLQPLDTAQAFRDMKADENGMFEIPNLPYGDYQIMANQNGYKVALMGEPVYSDGFNPVKGVVVTLTPVDSGNFTVYGTVTDSDGRPIGDVQLSLTGMGVETMSTADFSTTSDAMGQYGFYGVEPGYLVLTAGKQGYAKKVIERVRLDEPTDIVLERSAGVRGRVLVRETGQAPESYTVRLAGAEGAGGLVGLLADTGGHSGRHFTNSDGSFELLAPAGEYTLEAQARGLTPGRLQVSIAPGQYLEGVTVYVSTTGGRIQGRVVKVDGSTPAGALVWLSQGEVGFSSVLEMAGQSQQKGITVGQDGAFEFVNLADGPYTVMARAEGYAQASAGPVVVERGRPTPAVTVSLGLGGQIQGYVISGGQYQAGAFVTALGPGTTQMSTTDQNGYYVLGGLASGTYMLTAVSLQGGGLAGAFSPLHGRAEVVEGQITTYNFGEEVGATIEGLCTPEPAAGTLGFAIVRVPGAPGGVQGLNLTNPGSWFSGGAGLGNFVVGMAQVGRDGYFKITNIPEGSFLLEVYYRSMGEVLSGVGSPVYSSPVNVQGRENMRLDISVSAP